MLNEGDNIRSMAAAGTLNMVGMNRAVLESCRSVFDEARFVKTIGMNFTLNIEFIANPAFIDQRLRSFRCVHLPEASVDG